MTQKFPLCESVTIDTLLEIAKRRFPEYKSYKQRFINGKFVCINRNPLFRATIKVTHNPKKQTSTLVVYKHQTVLGSILAGALWVYIFNSFFNEVEEVYVEEMNQLTR